MRGGSRAGHLWYRLSLARPRATTDEAAIRSTRSSVASAQPDPAFRYRRRRFSDLQYFPDLATSSSIPTATWSSATRDSLEVRASTGHLPSRASWWLLDCLTGFSSGRVRHLRACTASSHRRLRRSACAIRFHPIRGTSKPGISGLRAGLPAPSLRRRNIGARRFLNRVSGVRFTPRAQEHKHSRLCTRAEGTPSR
jgi:hypothetical protein